ncbi:MAG: hypothetical protein IJO19_05295 [Clostridia bacterium]|nr:hypothetical protein [Clostridia bacterium]
MFVKLVIAGKYVFEIPDSVPIQPGDYIISKSGIEYKIDDYSTFIADSNEYELFKKFADRFLEAKAIHREVLIDYDTFRN